MRAFLGLILLSSLLNACATVDETPLTLDNEPPAAAAPPLVEGKKAASKKSSNTKSAAKTDKASKSDKVEDGIVVDNTDVELANRMTVAMDAFVFKFEVVLI